MSRQTALGFSAALLLLWGSAPHEAVAQSLPEEQRVIVHSRGWELIGDLMLPAVDSSAAAVLMLNQAAGDRRVYEELAHHLAARAIASLRLDLPGHGESTNIRAFVPGEQERDPIIWESQVEVVAAYQYLTSHDRVDGSRIAVVGASYSGEEMAEAGRLHGYAQAYVALSPGSISDASINGIDSSGVPWLLIVSRDDRFLKEITAEVRARSETAEVLALPGTAHASDLLARNPGLAERVAVWIEKRLEPRCGSDPESVDGCDPESLH
jgi:dienelactone hydrolase